MRSILLAIKTKIQLASISSLFLHHNQKFGMMAVLTNGRVRDQTKISTKAGWLNMLAGAHQQAAEEFTFGPFLEEKVALYEAYENDQGYSSMVR